MERQHSLEQLRRHRRVPAVGVVIFVGPVPLGPWDYGEDGTVHVMRVDPSECIDRLDLRCVVGLKVLVVDDLHTPDERSVRAVCAACVTAGASSVVGMAGGRSGLTDSDTVFDFSSEVH